MFSSITKLFNSIPYDDRRDIGIKNVLRNKIEFTNFNRKRENDDHYT